MASALILTTLGSKTVLATAETEETPLGLASPLKNERYSKVFTRMSFPSFQRLWQEKVRPGKYSESVKDVAGTLRISSQ